MNIWTHNKYSIEPFLLKGNFNTESAGLDKYLYASLNHRFLEYPLVNHNLCNLFR